MHANNFGEKGENTTMTFTEKNKIVPVELNMVSSDLKHSANTKEMKS